MDSPQPRTFQFDLPMRIPINKRGEVEALNLNVYRNLHHYKHSALKKNFHKLMVPKLKHLPKMDKITLHYQVFPKTRGRLDTMNVGSIVDKFFSDVLVEAGVIPDDDYTHVVFNSFEIGPVCKDNPRVVVTITEINPTKKEKPMRILLDENDIQIALTTYVEELGISGATGVELRIENDEIVAEVLTGDAPVSVAKPAPKTRKPRAKKEVVTDVVEPSEIDSGDRNTGTSETAELTTEEAIAAIGEAQPTDTVAETRNSKNLFEESPEESSETPTLESEADNTSAPVKPAKKKSSIFDA